MSISDIETPHELVLVDELPAPPEAVWAAWTEPERFAAWWVGPGFETIDLTLEVTAGGRFSAVQRALDGSMTIPFDGFYREADAPSRLVLVLGDGDTAEDEARTELSVTLRPAAGGTVQEFRQTGVVTDEHFAQLKAGTELFFGQLRDLLARG